MGTAWPNLAKADPRSNSEVFIVDVLASSFYAMDVRHREWQAGVQIDRNPHEARVSQCSTGLVGRALVRSEAPMDSPREWRGDLFILGRRVLARQNVKRNASWACRGSPTPTRRKPLKSNSAGELSGFRLFLLLNVL